ncbi:MAG: cysteine desulfurase family protein [Mariprofundus sp.]|nr:cysteine desulfurase family protein [Mariprofundus sp.]
MNIYLDYNATTPIDRGVLDSMKSYMEGKFGNPSSAHVFGWEAEIALENARQKVAESINANPDEIFFTSGATEANNTVIRWAYEKGIPIITSKIEHKSVLSPVQYLQRKGHDVSLLEVNSEGLPQLPISGLKKGSLLTIMAVNNEVHTVCDLHRMGAFCKKHDLIFHADCSQALGKIEINVKDILIDMLSISGHKIYGPKGIGALFISKKFQKKFSPYLIGGGQERGLRGGTSPVFLCVGLGSACSLVTGNLKEYQELYTHFSHYFIHSLSEKKISYELIGQPIGVRQPGGVSLCITGLNAREWCEKHPEIAISQGSACNSKSGSHVLNELKISQYKINSVIRVSFGKDTKNSEIDMLVNAIHKQVKSMASFTNYKK